MSKLKNHSNRIISVIIMACLLMVMITGCSGNQTETGGKETGDGNVEAQMNIPDDGVITADTFTKIQGLNQTIDFIGKDANSGIAYDWCFNGKNIQNPVDMNLNISFVTQAVGDIREASGGADYILGMTLQGNGLITVPDLTVTLTDKWDTDSVVLCKNQNGTLGKMADVTIDNSGSASVLKLKVTELGDTYYFLAGKTVKNETETASDANTAEATKESEGQTQTENTQEETTQQTTVAEQPQQTTQQQTTVAQQQTQQSQKEETQQQDKKLTCTFSISCATILDNMDNLDSSKKEFVPSDGWILKPQEIEFTEGESVHDILTRVCKANGIQMESSFTPAYNSAYIEGINQLYEFDCGNLSGWMFSVNGWFPNYGCSKYEVSDKDVIKWVYTCDLGKDVGDNSMY